METGVMHQAQRVKKVQGSVFQMLCEISRVERGNFQELITQLLLDHPEVIQPLFHTTANVYFSVRLHAGCGLTVALLHVSSHLVTG